MSLFFIKGKALSLSKLSYPIFSTSPSSPHPSFSNSDDLGVSGLGLPRGCCSPVDLEGGPSAPRWEEGGEEEEAYGAGPDDDWARAATG